MLLTRVDVTLQSFLWSQKAAGREDEIGAVLRAQQQHLSAVTPEYKVICRHTYLVAYS